MQSIKCVVVGDGYLRPLPLPLPFRLFSLPPSARSSWRFRPGCPESGIPSGVISFKKTRFDRGGAGFLVVTRRENFWTDLGSFLGRWVKRVFSSATPQMPFPENTSPQCTNPNRLLNPGIRTKLTCCPVDSTITLQTSWLMENR